MKSPINNITKKTNILQLLINIYTFFFIFTMINREFLFFGFDLRFIQLPLGLIILTTNLFSKKNRPAKKKGDSIGPAMIAFYVYAFVSSINWLWNGLDPDTRKFINELILLANVFVGLLVFYLNHQRLNAKYTTINVAISCLILSLSILLVHQGFTLEQISGSSDVAYIGITQEGANNSNLFGESFRCAGYASDPNYATLLLLIGIICIIKSTWLKSIKIILITILGVCMGLSFSRTIFLAITICGLYVFITSILKARPIIKIKLNRLLIIGIILTAIAIPLIWSIFPNLPLTLSLRIGMWSNANQIFLHNPFFGNGITSFRSGMLLLSNWYVHAHSTYWQILSELGIIGMILYYRVALKALNNSINRPLNHFLILVFVIWAFTYETIAFPFCIFIYYIIGNNVLDKKEPVQNKTALFFVNSLKQGGAEKVCLNLANALKKENYSSEFITLKQSPTDEVDYPTFNLRCNSKNKLIRSIQILFSIPKANDYITAQQADHGDYDLVTSHLPISNIITRFSCIGRQAIYVIHLSMNAYQFGTAKLYHKLVRLFFRRHKVVAVSHELRQELLNIYGLQPKLTKTIYNPIDFEQIRRQIAKESPLEQPYFLHVGRFEPQKRQDRMLKVFKAGKFYDNYHLVFCGTGSTLDSIKEQAKKMGIAKNVHFVGYQDNIYTWMSHAAIVVGTSDFESFQINLAEAYACGTKVVSSDCDFGPREILLDDYAQFLVKPIDDIDQYIEKINLALDHYPKTKKRILSELQPSKIIQKYLSFYRV